MAAAVAVPLLPAAPARADEPAGTTVVGELVQAWPEVAGATAADAPAAVTWVETADGDSVRIADRRRRRPDRRLHRRVTVGDEATAAAGTPPPVLAPRSLAARPTGAAPGRAATNQVTVALVAPAGSRPTPRRAPADRRPGRRPGREVLGRETDGAVALGVTETRDWVTPPPAAGRPAACGTRPPDGRLRARPRQAPAALPPPTAPGCAYGLAEIGSDVPPAAALYVRDALPSLIAHELGHNFGLGHSSALHCDGAAEAGGCDTAAYRDHYDVMGVSWAEVGSLNAVQAATLGLLPAAQRSVPAAGRPTTSRSLRCRGRAASAALRLIGAAAVDYWLEYRPAAGRDPWLGTGADRFGLDGRRAPAPRRARPRTPRCCSTPHPAPPPDGTATCRPPRGRRAGLADRWVHRDRHLGRPSSGATVEITSTAAASDALPGAHPGGPTPPRCCPPRA